MSTNEEFDFKRILPIAIIVGAVLLLIIFWSRMTVTIPAGHGGVLFKLFSGGVDTEQTYKEGFHFLAPWNSMYLYETRQQEVAEEMNVCLQMDWKLGWIFPLGTSPVGLN